MSASYLHARHCNVLCLPSLNAHKDLEVEYYCCLHFNIEKASSGTLNNSLQNLK